MSSKFDAMISHPGFGSIPPQRTAATPDKFSVRRHIEKHENLHGFDHNLLVVQILIFF